MFLPPPNRCVGYVLLPPICASSQHSTMSPPRWLSPQLDAVCHCCAWLRPWTDRTCAVNLPLVLSHLAI